MGGERTGMPQGCMALHQVSSLACDRPWCGRLPSLQTRPSKLPQVSRCASSAVLCMFDACIQYGSLSVAPLGTSGCCLHVVTWLHCETSFLQLQLWRHIRHMQLVFDCWQNLSKHKYMGTHCACAGTDHSIMLTRGGEMYTWGTGRQGQLGRIGVRMLERDDKVPC